MRYPVFNRRILAFTRCCSILVVALGVAGCATDVEQRGLLPDPDRIAQIHPGSSSRDDVQRILGTPSSVGVFSDNAWYYISRRTEQFSFFDPSVVDQQVYIIAFDDKGIVSAIDKKDLKDGREIDPVARTTPAPGRELTFMEQLIGNVGRFGGGDSGK